MSPDSADRLIGVTAYWLCRTVDTTSSEFWAQVRRAWPAVWPPIPAPEFDRPVVCDDAPDVSAYGGPGPAGGERAQGQKGATVELSSEQLVEWCEDLVADLGVPMPLDPYILCDRVAHHRGRVIKVRVVDLGATTTIGHLVAKRGADLILCDHEAPEPQRALIIFHELVHLLRHDLGAGQSMVCGVEPVDAPVPVASMYADWREREAETAGRILAGMAHRRPRPDVPAAAGAAGTSVAAAFGLRLRRARRGRRGSGAS